MTKKKALKYIADGHFIIPIETAKAVCEAFNVRYNEEELPALVWKNAADAKAKYGFDAHEDNSGKGVSLTCRLGFFPGRYTKRYTGKNFFIELSFRL